MTFSSYPEYKDSGHEWMGEIPNHWLIYRSKNIFSERNVKALECDEQLTASQKYGVIPQKLFSELEDQKVMQVILGRDILKKAEVNDFVISMRSFQGGLEFCPYSGAVSSAYVPLFANREIDNRFFKHLFKSVPFISALQNTSNLVRDGQALRYNNFVQLSLPYPLLNEQRTIGAFLDHETARIDALIEEQQRLIELLKEKRQAVISHAVTKGLDPTVPMKDSGVEWLGEVPAHWIISQLKFNTTEMQTGPFGSQLHAEDYVDGGIPLINPAHMVDGRIIPDLQVSVDEKTWSRLSRHALKAGEIIFARRGELGRCAVVSKEQEGWLCGTGSLKASLNSRLSSEYAYLLVTSKGVVSELSLESKGSTMENLNTETLGRVRLPLPPLSEQEAILEHVHEIAGQFAALIHEAEDGIKLITERRSALISAAVTGKIDVRGWQPPPHTQAPDSAVVEAN